MESFIEGDLPDLLEATTENLFVTGRGGTGKSSALQRWVETTKRNVIVTAPTGIAAVNVSGMTLHKCFNIPPKALPNAELIKIARKQKPYVKEADVLVLDEVSMCRADMMDNIDLILRVCRKSDEPFGGIVLVAFGDLYQLPPVIRRGEEKYFKDKYGSGHFFASKVIKENPIRCVELTRPFRQRDPEFIDALNSIRDGSNVKDSIKYFNKRYDPKFTRKDGYVFMVPTNSQADAINKKEMSLLRSDEKTYFAILDGKFPESGCPVDGTLTLKIGAQVMLVKNTHTSGRVFANGEVGIIEELREEDVSVRFQTGEVASIGFAKWSINEPDITDGELTSKELGSFEQIPLKPSWAATIHKNQGRTIKKAVIDMGSGAFACGQTYVALSRCVSIEGMVLKTPLTTKDITVDKQVVKYMADTKAAGRHTEFAQKIVKQEIPIPEEPTVEEKTVCNDPVDLKMREIEKALGELKQLLADT